jgi:hypothetical protein
LTARALQNNIDRCSPPAEIVIDGRAKKFVFALILIGNLLMLSPQLLPRLADFNWDEAVYVNNGRYLVDANLIPFASNPLTGLLYAPFYLFMKHQIFWMPHAATAGRLIILALLWAGCLLLAWHFKETIEPLFLLALFGMSKPASLLLMNSSDSLFAANSAIALFFFLSCARSGNLRQMIYASAFAAFAALSRNDGLLLYAIMLALSALHGMRAKRFLPAISCAAIPFVVIVGFYLSFYALTTGNIDFGIAKRSYIAFAQGQGFVYENEFKDRFVPVAGPREADRLYGTESENSSSIFKAIGRNPGAFLDRTVKTTRKLPAMFADAYGKKTFPVFLALGILGATVLLRLRRHFELLILLAWSAHLTVYFLTFFRKGYLVLPFFVLFILAAVGLQALYFDSDEYRRRRSWIIFTVFAASFSLMFDVFVAVSAVVVAFLAAALLMDILRRKGIRQGFAAVLLALATAFVAYSGIESGMRKTGLSGDEQAVVYMREHFGGGRVVAAFDPVVPFAALQSFADLANTPGEYVGTREKLLELIRAHRIGAIYIDPQLTGFQPDLCRLLQSEVDSGLKRSYLSPDGRYGILEVVDSPFESPPKYSGP